MMRKSLYATALAAALACATAHAQQLRIASNFPTQHTSSVAMEQFKAEVEAATGKALGVDLFPAMQLGGAQENVDQVRSGAIFGTVIGAAFLSRTVPEISALSVPFLFTERKQAFRVVDGKGDREFLVDVSGAFTTARPGLLRTDTLWKTLGRAHVLKSLDEYARLLIVTSNLPRPGSDGERALHAVGPGNVWDAVEMFDAGGVGRLAAYARGHVEQLPGFWTEQELAARRDEQLARYYGADDE